MQLLKVAKRNKASLSDETLDSLIATNIQVVVMPKLFIVRRDNHDHNVHRVRHVHRDHHHQENERKAAAGKTSLWDIFRSRWLLMLMLMLMLMLTPLKTFCLQMPYLP